MLSEQDVTKAAGILDIESQQRFIKSRAVLISILHSCLQKKGSPIGSLQFGFNENGKPYLRDHADMHFNLSHSGNYLLVALAGFPVGIDLEFKEKNDLLSETASVVFSEEEFLHLNSDNAGGFMEKFYNFWTRKEAYIKAIGCGFSCDPKKISIHDKSGLVNDCREENSEASPKKNADWHVHNLNILEGFAAALAVPFSDVSFTMNEFAPHSI